jgi:hypothetical protein
MLLNKGYLAKNTIVTSKVSHHTLHSLEHKFFKELVWSHHVGKKIINKARKNKRGQKPQNNESFEKM